MRRMRKAGVIPAVVYGKSGNRSLSIQEKDFRELSRQTSGGAALVDIKDDKGVELMTVIHDVQRDPVYDSVEHVDFHELQAGVKMTAHVSVHVTGEAYGVKNEGAVLDVVSHSLDVECLPRHLPEYLEVDVTELKIHDSVHVSDLKLPEGVVVTNDPDQVVLACAESSARAAAEAEDKQAALEAERAAEKAEAEGNGEKKKPAEKAEEKPAEGKKD